METDLSRFRAEMANLLFLFAQFQSSEAAIRNFLQLFFTRNETSYLVIIIKIVSFRHPLLQTYFGIIQQIHYNKIAHVAAPI